jgi:hypothetical protein
MTLEELKEHLVRHGDIIFLLDVLDLSMEQLVEALTDHIEEQFDKVVDDYDLVEEDNDE